MKRGFLNNPNVVIGGLLKLPSPASISSLRTASLHSPTNMESVFQAIQRSSSSVSQADLDLQKMQNELFDARGGEKLEYGKVETVAIPKDYKPANTSTSPIYGDKIDHTAGIMIIMTSIPSKPFTGPLDPDGHSEWIVYGPTKAKVINAPGYPQPVPKPKGTQPAYIIKPSPNMGLGVFATRDIKMGELIFAERPLLVSPRSNIGVNVGSLEQYDWKTQIAIAMMEWEKTLEIAVGRMEPEDRKAFMELANSHKEDGSGPILGIIRTNGFMVGGDIYDGPEKRADGHNAYSAVVKIGSRINHSCMPNVKMGFSTPSFSFQFSAVVDIKAGEQLFYGYCEVEQPVADRQLNLAPYGIVCSCPACTHATPETDKLRTEFRKIAMDYIVNKNWIWNKATSGRVRQVAESAIEPLMQFKDALIKEGLHYTSEYKSMILLLQNFYEAIGMKEKARLYKKEYERYRLSTKLKNGALIFNIPKYY